ncbi:T9SS type B sorting domain-containing protein [Myroides ceti]|uniref:T9SS type B sorting domain-containing protein n=1 Tax=Paenimyroides ceti TaxID=395087 RepID=A0ABT8CMY8_9FLAO|nr:T9SS type B sorting domain-containing protein [Paenimyroides ceti]MDN3705665.1 T9SS type B sorting domain-containing protein [Paenimyroides ceti]
MLFFTASGYSQYSQKHYIAPAPWQYWSTANEIVISTASPGQIEVTLEKSDGTFITNLTVTANIPISYRFLGVAANLQRNAVNTLYNDRGLIVTATAPVIVNMRNIASDAIGLTNATIKGNASLVSFGDEGIGTEFRVGYYRSSFTGLNTSQPIYSVMAIEDGTEVIVDGGAPIALNAGQSQLFTAPLGSLMTANKPVVANVGSYGDTPQACGGNGEDGTFDQMAPNNVLGNQFLVVRGSGAAGTGANHPEQSTIVATQPGTLVNVKNYDAAGVLLNSTDYELLLAGNFQTFHHGDATNQYSSSLIVSNNPITVYSGTAVACETDVSTVLPIGGCAGASDVRTRKFISFNNTDLPYFGYTIIESATEPVFINGLNIETVTGIPRTAIGTSGFYMIRFNNINIGNPVEIILTSNARLTTSLVQQGEGFSMSGFFSAFSDSPAQPLAPNEQDGCGIELSTTTGLEPYQWYLNGNPIDGANQSTYIALETGNYSVRGTRECGLTAISSPLFVEVVPCTDLAIQKEVEQNNSGVFFQITVSNIGGFEDPNVLVTDVLPTGYTFVTATPSQGTYDPISGVWTVGALAPDASATLTIEVFINVTGDYLNTASVKGDNVDLNQDNNVDTAIITDLEELAPLQNLAICADQPNSFDLTVQSAIVYYGQLGYLVTYHHSLNEANSNTGAIQEPELSNYQATDGETIWVRVSQEDNISIYATTSFRLFIHPLPVANTNRLPMYGCEINGSGFANFNLALNQSNIIGTATGINLSYYQTEAEAENGGPSLPLNYTGPQGTLYVRVEYAATGCFIVVEQQLLIRNTPIANPVGPVTYCDPNNDGFGIFNLEALKIQIAGNPIPAGIQVSFHETLSDAQNNVLPINQVVNYVNITPNAQTIYARVGYINSSCSSIVPVTLIVNPTPDVIGNLEYAICDDNNDGLAVFDLTSQAGVILNGLNPADYTLSYHTTFDNATFDVFPISNPTAFSNLTSETVYVRVENNTTGCFRVVTLHLVVNAKPVVPNPVPTYQLCDDNHDGFMIFNLASRIPAITNNQSNLLVTFHYTAADAQNDVAPLPMNYQNAVQNVQTLHVRVEDARTGCFTLTTMDIRVSPAPVLHIPAAPIAVCASGQGGFGTIDLTSYAALLLQGENYTLTFFETESNALNNQAPIQNPAQYNNLQANNPVVWVRATNPVTNCFSVYALAFKLEIAPIMPLTLPNYVSCDTVGDLFDGLTSFDLTQQSAAIIAFQPQPGNYTVRYYTSLASATAGTGWIADPTAFVNTTNPQTIWVRIDNANVLSGGCFALGSFTIEGKTALPLGTPTPIVSCNEALPNDFQTVFDLTIRELQILQGEVFEAVVTYHLTETEARSGSNAIGNPTAYTNTSATQTIWVSVINQYGCRSVVPLTLRVLPLPEPNMTPAPLTECEIEDGEAEFNLRDAEADISNFDNNLSYEYYLTFGDAQLGNTAAALTLEEAEAFTSASTTVYVRVSTKTGIPSESCSVVVPLDLIVIPTPAVGPMTPLFVCIENAPEYYKFNLHDKDAQALAGQDASLFSVRYYLTEEDATDAINPLPYLYTNVTPTEQTIWVRVENIEHGCFAIASFNLKIEEAVKAFTPTDVTFCDVDGVNDGLTVVDLTVMSADIIGTQPVTGLQVRYYASVQNYQMGIVIGTPTAYQTVSNPQTIIAEVYNNDSNELCTATIQFDINVIDGPIMKDIPDGFICIDYRTQERTGYLMDTGLPAAGHTFVWTRNGTVVGGNTPTFTATEAGTYTVEVTVNATGCKAIQTIIVQDAPALTIDVVNLTDGFSDTNAIEVIVSGPAGYQYEYALDEGPYQEENIFMNVSPGDHTVWVRVKNQAGNEACPASLVVTVLNYPKYFTPNGDGYNDTWNIPALKNQPKSKIYIFDRQGKLLKQISPAGAGWDGTLNGKPLPSTDYWFKVEYIEPNTGLQKEATGHFSLKR